MRGQGLAGLFEHDEMLGPYNTIKCLIVFAGYNFTQRGDGERIFEKFFIKNIISFSPYFDSSNNLQ